MGEAASVLQNILRQAWVAVASFIVIVAVLGGLAQVFKFSGGMLLGSGMWVSEAVVGVLGVIVIALMGFLAVPNIAKSGMVAANVGCGPLAEIGQFAAVIIGGVGSLRMLVSVFQAVASASLGASRGVSTALTEIAEVLLGMLLITVAAPVATAFLGGC